MRGSSSLSNSLASCFLVAARVGRDQPLRRDLDEIWMISDEGLLFFLEIIKIEVEAEIAGKRAADFSISRELQTHEKKTKLIPSAFYRIHSFKRPQMLRHNYSLLVQSTFRDLQRKVHVVPCSGKRVSNAVKNT